MQHAQPADKAASATKRPLRDSVEESSAKRQAVHPALRRDEPPQVLARALTGPQAYGCMDGCRGQQLCTQHDIAAASALSEITLPPVRCKLSLQAHPEQRMQAGAASNARPAVFACFPATKPHAASQAAAEPLRPFPHGQAAGVATSPASGLKVGLFSSLFAILTVSGRPACISLVWPPVQVRLFCPQAWAWLYRSSSSRQSSSMSAQLWCS